MEVVERKNWNSYIFSEIGSVINGDRGKNYPSKRYYISKGIPFISAGNIKDNKLDSNNLNFISNDRYKLLNNGKLKKYDIIYCIRGSLGKCAIFNLDKAAIASSLCILRLNENINTKFVYYYLLSPFGDYQIVKYNNGTAQPNLSGANFSKFKISIPSEQEQELIVAEIETQFTRLDSAIKILQTIKKKLEVYRESILKVAFTTGFSNIKFDQLGLVNITSKNKHSIKRGPFGSAITKAMFVPKSSNTYKIYEQKHAIRNDCSIGTYYINQGVPVVEQVLTSLNVNTSTVRLVLSSLGALSSLKR